MTSLLNVFTTKIQKKLSYKSDLNTFLSKKISRDNENIFEIQQTINCNINKDNINYIYLKEIFDNYEKRKSVFTYVNDKKLEDKFEFPETGFKGNQDECKSLSTAYKSQIIFIEIDNEKNGEEFDFENLLYGMKCQSYNQKMLELLTKNQNKNTNERFALEKFINCQDCENAIIYVFFRKTYRNSTNDSKKRTVQLYNHTQNIESSSFHSGKNKLINNNGLNNKDFLGKTTSFDQQDVIINILDVTDVYTLKDYSDVYGIDFQLNKTRNTTFNYTYTPFYLHLEKYLMFFKTLCSIDYIKVTTSSNSTTDQMFIDKDGENKTRNDRVKTSNSYQNIKDLKVNDKAFIKNNKIRDKDKNDLKNVQKTIKIVNLNKKKRNADQLSNTKDTYKNHTNKFSKNKKKKKIPRGIVEEDEDIILNQSNSFHSGEMPFNLRDSMSIGYDAGMLKNSGIYKDFNKTINDTWNSFDSYEQSMHEKDHEDLKENDVIEQYNQIESNNQNLLKKFLQFSIEEQKLLFENNISNVDLRLNYQYSYFDEKMAKSMQIDQFRANELIQQRLSMYNEIFYLIEKKICKSKYLESIFKEKTDNKTIDNRDINNDQEDYLDLTKYNFKYTQIIMDKIESEYFDCSTEIGRKNDFESYQLCIIISSTNSDFENYFMLMESKLQSFRFKYKICVSQAKIDHYIEENSKFFQNEIYSIPFSLLYDRRNSDHFNSFSQSMPELFFNETYKSKTLYSLIQEIFKSLSDIQDIKDCIECIVEHFKYDLEEKNLCSILFNIKCLELDFLQLPVEEQDTIEFFKILQQQIGSCKSYYEKNLATKYYIVDAFECQQMWNERTIEPLQRYNNLVQNKKHFLQCFSDVLEFKNDTVCNLPIAGKLLLNFKQMHRYFKYMHLNRTRDKILTIRKSKQLYYSKLWLVQDRLAKMTLNEQEDGGDKENIIDKFINDEFKPHKNYEHSLVSIKEVKMQSNSKLKDFKSSIGNEFFDEWLWPLIIQYYEWMFSQRKECKLIIKNGIESYKITKLGSNGSTNDDENDIFNMDIDKIDEMYIKPLDQQNDIIYSERNQFSGFLKIPNKYYIDSKLMKDCIFPRTFQDYIVFAEQNWIFPPCIASILLNCVEKKQHPKNNERLILGKFLFSLYFSEEQVIDFFAKLYSYEEKYKDITAETFYKTGDKQLISGIKYQHAKNGSPSCTDIANKGLCPFYDQKLTYKSNNSQQTKNSTKKYILKKGKSNIVDIEDLLIGYSQITGSKTLNPCSKHCKKIELPENYFHDGETEIFKTHSKKELEFEVSHAQKLCTMAVRNRFVQDNTEDNSDDTETPDGITKFQKFNLNKSLRFYRQRDRNNNVQYKYLQSMSKPLYYLSYSIRQFSRMPIQYEE